MRNAREIAVIVCMVLVTACASSVGPSPRGSATPMPSTGPSPSLGPAGSAKVVLGLYSGRPDPEWTLTTVQAATLEKALAALADGTGTPPTGGLGYHGFTILLPGRTLMAYRGVVTATGDGPRTLKLDPARTVERYLLETSRSHLTADEYAEVERALTGP